MIPTYFSSGHVVDRVLCRYTLPIDRTPRFFIPFSTDSVQLRFSRINGLLIFSHGHILLPTAATAAIV